MGKEWTFLSLAAHHTTPASIYNMVNSVSYEMKYYRRDDYFYIGIVSHCLKYQQTLQSKINLLNNFEIGIKREETVLRLLT